MAESQSTAGLVYASAVAADAFARSLLQAHGVPPEDAAIIAGCLVSADLLASIPTASVGCRFIWSACARA